MIRNLNDWTEVTRGLYRYVIVAKVAYEIHIIYRDYKDPDILNARCKLYLVGEWYTTKNSGSQMFFQRQFLAKGSMKECLESAVKDDEENNI